MVLSNTVAQYLIPSVRRSTYAAVEAKKLRALLEKLAKYGASSRIASEREKGEERRKEAEAIGRLLVEDR